MGTAIVLIILGIITGTIIFSMIKKHKAAKKNGTCCCGCSCSCSGSCHSGK